jgi:hypothetical protein
VPHGACRPNEAESVISLHQSKRTECSLCKKMYTYSKDLFMIAFFTLIARGVSTTALVAGGGVTSAGGAVPATAMVTNHVAEADRSVPISWRSGSGGEAGGLQKDNVSVQQYRYLTIQQGSIFIPVRLDFLHFPFAHYPTTLRDRGQSFGQLHGWFGGVVPSRLPLGFPFCQGALTSSGLTAGQSLGYSSPLRFGCGAGEEVVRSRDVGLWRLASVQLCESLTTLWVVV